MAQVNVYDHETRQVAQGCDFPETPIVKRGHSCFGFGCDMRRAVIWINIINMFFYTISLALGILAINNYISLDYTMPAVPGVDAKYTDAVLYGIVIGSYVICMLFFFAGLMGAVNFSKCLVITALVFYMLMVASTIAGWIIAKSAIWYEILTLVVEILFVYPHFVLAREINAKIMTSKNYRFEKRGCCCV